MKLGLRDFCEEDFGRLITWIDTPALLGDWSAKYFSYPLDHAELARYLASASETVPGRRIFTAVDRDDGDRPIGHGELSQIWPHLSARASRLLVGDQEDRGRGIGVELLRSLVAFAFETYHVDRVDLGVSTQNRAAIRCYEKCGFAHVGTWPDAFETAGDVIDVYWMTRRRGKP